MSTRPAGHALVEALIAQGVHTAFGVPGESYLAVLDGFPACVGGPADDVPPEEQLGADEKIVPPGGQGQAAQPSGARISQPAPR